MGCGASSQSEQTALSTRPLPTQHPAGVTTLSPHPPATAFRYPTVDERSTSASPPFLDGGDSNTPQHLQQPSSRRSSSRQQQQQRLSAQDTQISLHLQGARPPQPHPPFTSSNNSLGATPSRHLLFGSALPSPSSSSHHHHLRTDDDEYSSRDQVHHSRSATPLSSASGFRSSMLDGVGNHMELHRHQSMGSNAPSEFGGMMGGGGVGSSRSTTVGGATTASLQQVTLINPPVSSSSPASAFGLLLGVVVGASGNSSSVGGRGGTIVNSFAPIDPSGFDPPLLEDVVADDFLRTSMPGSSSASSRTTRKNENDDLRSSSSTATATNATAPPPPNNAATTAKSVHCPQTAYSLANVSPRMTGLKTMTTTSSVSPPRQHLHQRSVSNPLQQGATATAIVETTITTTTTTATTESASTTTFSPTTAVPPPFSSQGVFHFNSNNNDNSPTLSFQPPNGSFDAFRLSPQQTSLHSNPQQQRRLSTSSPSLVGVSEKRPDDQNALISVLPPRRGSGGDQQQRHHQPPPRSKHQFNKDSPLPTNSTSSLWGRRSGGTNPAHSASNGASAAPAAQLPEAGAATALSPLVAGGVGFPSTNSSIKSSPSSSNRNVPPENLPFVNPQSPSSSRKLVVGNGSFSSSATSTIANHCELSHLQFSQFGGGLFNPQEQNDEISDGGGGVASGGGAGGGISCEDLITSQQKSAAQPPATAQTTASPSRHQPLRTTPKAAKNTVHVPNHHHHHPQGSKYEQHNNSEVYGADDDGDNDDDELQSSGHSLNSRKKSLPGGALVAPGGDKEDDDVSEHEHVDEATTAEAANRQHLILPHVTKKLSHRNAGGGGGHTPLDPEDFDDIDVTTHQPLDGEEEPEGEQKGKSNEIGGIGYNKENRASAANFAPSSSGAKAMTHQHRLQRGAAAHSIRGDVDSSESNLSRGVLLLPHAHSEGGGIVVVVGGQLQPATSGSDAPPVGAAAPAAAAAALPPLSSPFRPLNFLQLNPQSMSSLISGESVGAPTWPTTAIEID
ncbi:Hypothetical protein, putative [Bodo saltans]|uniref:Uncharacterized protein n=1 Tax=Bodo saltans TaxID=75058 RepID=A0A0S4J315_BODSA|nr:Hypothetical protein, putative [Bodo saltans]|eukprot:CUG70033.1 Hypothetical protein, putative [Bodo saltans]